MKPAAKLVSIVVPGLIAVLMTDGYLSVEKDVEVFEAGMKSDAHLFGRAMAGLVPLARRSGGESLIGRLISEEDQGARQMHIRPVRLNAPPGDPDGPGAAGGGHGHKTATDRTASGRRLNGDSANQR